MLNIHILQSYFLNYILIFIDILLDGILILPYKLLMQKNIALFLYKHIFTVFSLFFIFINIESYFLNLE